MLQMTRVAIVGLCSVFLFSLVSAPEACAAGADVFTITKEQSGSELNVKPGDILQIELPTLGSAGYDWHMSGIDGVYLELISEGTRPVAEDGKVGAPVIRIWRFQTKKPGTTEIKMDQYRQWEGIGKSVDHFFLKILVSGERG